jgi:hypothetical protein
MKPLVAYRSMRSGRIPSAAKKITRSADGLSVGTSIPRAPSSAMKTIRAVTPTKAARQVVILTVIHSFSGNGYGDMFWITL